MQQRTARRSLSGLRAASWLALAALVPSQRAAHAQEPAAASDQEWITISGTVVATTPQAFRLDYGAGLITVEMDDADWYQEGRNLLLNDRVTVYGRVDKDAYERRTIEAGSVYVRNLGTYFYASSADEEDFALWTPTPLTVGDVEMSGTVASISGRELTLRSGFQIDTSMLGYNPLDDKGYQRIDVGDRIKVGGRVEDDLSDKTELMARWIINLSGQRVDS